MYTKEQLQQYADRGLSISETSLELEADRTSVNRYAKKFEVIFVKKKKGLTEEIKNTIKLMINEGKTNRQIVETLKFSTATISRIRREMNGLEPRPRKNKKAYVEENKTSTKVREFNLKIGDTFEVEQGNERKKEKVIYTVIEIYKDIFIGINKKGVKESFQIKEYEYGLI